MADREEVELNYPLRLAVVEVVGDYIGTACDSLQVLGLRKPCPWAVDSSRHAVPLYPGQFFAHPLCGLYQDV